MSEDKVIKYKRDNDIFTVTIKNMGAPNATLINVLKQKERKPFWTYPKIAWIIGFQLLLYIKWFTCITYSTFVCVVNSYLAVVWDIGTFLLESESVLVVPNFGLEKYVKYQINSDHIHIPWPRTNDFIINEVFKGNRVLFILTVVTRKNGHNTATEQIPLFEKSDLPLVLIEKIYTELQNILRSVNNETAQGSGDTG